MLPTYMYTLISGTSTQSDQKDYIPRLSSKVYIFGLTCKSRRSLTTAICALIRTIDGCMHKNCKSFYFDVINISFSTLSRTNFHSPTGVWAIKVRMYHAFMKLRLSPAYMPSCFCVLFRPVSISSHWGTLSPLFSRTHTRKKIGIQALLRLFL